MRCAISKAYLSYSFLILLIAVVLHTVQMADPQGVVTDDQSVNILKSPIVDVSEMNNVTK